MKRVLVLEDEFALAVQWREKLEAAGHEVIHVSRAAEAIEVLDEGSVDVLISDILIRDTEKQLVMEGGFSVLSHINLNVRPGPKRIVVSGAHPSLNVLRHAEALNAHVALAKPVDLDELLKAVND